MTKIDTKLQENISAYIDQELTEQERRQVEESLQTSASLRERVIEYRDLKETVSSIPGLSEDIYFESRFFDTVNQKKTRFAFFSDYRKPAVAFASLCILLMIFFQVKPNFMKTLVDSHSQALARLTDNLKPLLFATNLTKEDMFNFAFNKTIPLNKENDQFIKLGLDNHGQEFIEVKGADVTGGALNYNKFVSSLRLRPEQVKEMDKILEKYSDKVATSVLVNDKNTVAINSQIWSYHNDLRRELVALAAQANPSAMKALGPQVKIVTESAKNEQADGKNSNFYFCFTVDSVFTTPLNIDLSAIQKAVEAQKIEAKVSKNLAQLQKKLNIEIKNLGRNIPQTPPVPQSLVVLHNGKQVKVTIPDNAAPESQTPGFDEMTLQMDEIFENLRNFQVNFNSGESSNGKHVVGFQVNGEDRSNFSDRINSRSRKILQDTLKIRKMKNGKEIVIKIPRISAQGLNRSVNLDSLLNMTRKQVESAIGHKEDE